MNISIVSGWVPVVGQLLAVAALALAVDWRHGGWRRQLARGVPVAAGTTLVVALVCTLASLVPDDFPRLAWVWGFGFVLAVWVAATGWSSAGWRRRVVMVAAAVLTLAASLGTVNARSGAFPTVDRLLSGNPEHVTVTAQLAQIRSEVARTGRLPAEGAVITETIPATVSHFETNPATVYLPPAWFAKVTPSLPTLVLLPGEPGTASDWVDEGDADTTADAFAAAHGGVAPIIVMPDPNGVKTDDTECVNSQFGNAETYLVDDVPAFARNRFNASTAPGSLAIGGLSAGGTCSTMLALRHPTVYPTFASFSGFASPQFENDTQAQTIDILFGGSEQAFADHDPAELLRNGAYDGLSGWFEVGDEDTEPLDAAHQLQPAAASAGISTCILVRSGGHDYDLWSQALIDAFPWLAWHLGLTGQPSTEPATCTGS